jgi:hypothetical protein
MGKGKTTGGATRLKEGVMLQMERVGPPPPHITTERTGHPWPSHKLASSKLREWQAYICILTNIQHGVGVWLSFFSLPVPRMRGPLLYCLEWFSAFWTPLGNGGQALRRPLG